MYARVTRFEGSDPATLQQEIDGMRKQMENGLTDEAIDQMAEQVKGQFERDEVERLLKSIKRTLVLHGLGERKLRNGRVLRHGGGRPGCRCPVRRDVAGRERRQAAERGHLRGLDRPAVRRLDARCVQRSTKRGPDQGPRESRIDKSGSDGRTRDLRRDRPGRALSGADRGLANQLASTVGGGAFSV